VRQTRKANTAICEQTVQKMRESRDLSTLQALGGLLQRQFCIRVMSGDIAIAFSETVTSEEHFS
jgi:hypothetical protein